MHTPQPARNAQIVHLAREGFSYGQIGALFGITRQRVYFLVKHAGYSRNPNKGIANRKYRVTS